MKIRKMKKKMEKMKDDDEDDLYTFRFHDDCMLPFRSILRAFVFCVYRVRVLLHEIEVLCVYNIDTCRL